MLWKLWYRKKVGISITMSLISFYWWEEFMEEKDYLSCRVYFSFSIFTSNSIPKMLKLRPFFSLLWYGLYHVWIQIHMIQISTFTVIRLLFLKDLGRRHMETFVRIWGKHVPKTYVQSDCILFLSHRLYMIHITNENNCFIGMVKWQVIFKSQISRVTKLWPT